MLTVDSYLAEALKTHQVGGVRGVASYLGTNVELTVIAGAVTFNGDGEVQATATITVGGVGGSLVPRTSTDTLAPFGQTVSLFRTVTIRDTTWEIPLGVFKITKASNGFERFRGETVLDWSVDLQLTDLFEGIRADDFLAVEAPVSGNTAWAEIRRLARVAVAEALTDTTVPKATVYESRLGAVNVLTGLMGGVPHMTRTGALTARVRDAWLTETDAAFDIDGVITWSSDMTNEFYNQVQVQSSNDPAIVAYAQISSDANPLSVVRAGGRTYKHSAPIYQTKAAAQAAADTILSRVSTRRSRNVSVECAPDALLLELGDVGWVRDPVQGRAVFGEVSGLRVPLDPTAAIGVDLIVASEV